MELEVGAILEGKVTGITKFGAFVAFPGGGSGLVHISEIANAFVNDVHDYLTEGQTVQVKVLNINEAGKVNLSIKQVAAPPRPAAAPRFAPAGHSAMSSHSASSRFPSENGVHGPTGDASFEDKLKHFMQESDSKVSGNKLYGEKRSSSRRRRG